MTKKSKEYEQKLVDIRRVARIVAGGRRFRFRATVVIGNKKGKVGCGVAKGADVTDAVTKASARAKKNLINVSIINETIPHEVRHSFEGANVFLKPASKGTGVIAGGAVRAVVELAGIRNVLSKMRGSSNKINNVQATILALKKLRATEDVAKQRGRAVEQLGVKKMRQVSIKKPKVDKINHRKM